MPFETVLTESLLIIINYNKDKKRTNLNYKKIASIIHIRGISSVLEESISDFESQNLSQGFFNLGNYIRANFDLSTFDVFHWTRVFNVNFLVHYTIIW